MNYKYLVRALALFVIIMVCIKRPMLFHQQTAANNNEFSNGVYGIDVSHDQGTIDWQKVASSGLQFAYLKATDGITYTDPLYAQNLAAIKNTHLQVGAYHFFEAEDDPYKQLDNFLSRIKNQGLSLVPMVDVELTRAQSVEEIHKRLHTFLSELEKQIGCKPLLYSYGSFWQQNIGKQFNDYPFWFAEYADTMHAPSQLSNIQIWQYSQNGSVSGIDTMVDLDKVLDTEQGLEALKCNY